MQEWRDRLTANHENEAEIRLIFYRKEAGEPSPEYAEAVEEALCFGWVDSIIKKIDDSKYARKLTPRKESSKWSPSNKERVERLIRSGRMMPAGMSAIEAARKNGQWDKSDRPDTRFDPPPEFRAALDENRAAGEFFDRLPPTCRKQYIGWINVARRPETKEKRIRESIQQLEKGEKRGMR